MNQITVTIERETGKVTVDVPVPKEGKWEPTTDPKNPSPQPTLEQRAHYLFWSNGTQERINEVIKDNDGMAVKDTLIWLLGLRVGEVTKKTGWKYGLVIHEEPPTSKRFTKVA